MNNAEEEKKSEALVRVYGAAQSDAGHSHFYSLKDREALEKCFLKIIALQVKNDTTLSKEEKIALRGSGQLEVFAKNASYHAFFVDPTITINFFDRTQFTVFQNSVVCPQ